MGMMLKFCSSLLVGYSGSCLTFFFRSCLRSEEEGKRQTSFWSQFSESVRSRYTLWFPIYDVAKRRKKRKKKIPFSRERRVSEMRQFPGERCRISYTQKSFLGHAHLFLLRGTKSPPTLFPLLRTVQTEKLFMSPHVGTKWGRGRDEGKIN